MPKRKATDGPVGSAKGQRRRRSVGVANLPTETAPAPSQANNATPSQPEIDNDRLAAAIIKISPVPVAPPVTTTTQPDEPPQEQPTNVPAGSPLEAQPGGSTPNIGHMMDQGGYNMTNQTAIDPTSQEFPGYMFKALERTIGDESSVKIRRETADISRNLHSISDDNSFYSGSYAEGFRLKTSDRDIMYPKIGCIIINNASEANRIDDITFLQMNSRQSRPGYTRLKILNVDIMKDRSPDLVTSDGFLRNTKSQGHNLDVSVCLHGPAVMTNIEGIYIDHVSYISCNTWPTDETEFRTRSQQNNWPSPQIVDDIIQSGGHVVPVSSKFSEFEDSEWRISFSVAENKIVRTFNHTQFLCYGLMKLVLNHVIKRHFPDMLCSYFMKTLIFWEIQESENKDWKEGNILHHFWKCLERLTRWVSDDNCPNFFIPENNMFSCRFTVQQQDELLQFLRHLNERGNCIFPEIPDLHIVSDIRYASRLHTYEESTKCFIVIEAFLDVFGDHTQAFLTLLGNLQQNESSPEYVFVKETTEESIIKHLLCKAMIQFLSRGERGNRERYEIYHRQVRCYMERLEKGSVTARLWAATARYAIGQYSAAIDIIQYVKEVVHPMYDKGQNMLADVYQPKRICLPIMFNKYYFVPELYPEVQAIEQAERDCVISPSVYANWLLFMCYHHSKDQKRDAVLGNLHAYLNTQRYITLNMVGMCYALSGNHEKARKIFGESLKFSGRSFAAALWRIQQLDERSTEQDKSHNVK